MNVGRVVRAPMRHGEEIGAGCHEGHRRALGGRDDEASFEQLANRGKQHMERVGGKVTDQA